MLAEITGVLNESFHTYPPHTIQRLAELVVEPRKHYRSLPSYLHAVDRVVHVTSGHNIYPLPPAVPDMTHMHINGVTETASTRENSADHLSGQPVQSLWATTTSSSSSSNSSSSAPIGSDEALGGALLTPIPWLARQAANGGDGSSESGESSTLGSDAGGTSLPVGQGASANTNSSSSSSSSPSPSSTSQQRQGRQFEMQVRTESTETIDGPNGMGSIETVSVSINGVSSMSAAQQQRVITQGELIRQEQRAGVVPVSQLARGGPVVVTTTSSDPLTAAESEGDTAMGEGDGDRDTNSEKSDDDMADDEEAPHARGPDLIGAADMGPQKTGSLSTFSISHGGNVEVRGIDVEAAVGRKHEVQVPSADSQSDGAVASDDNDDAVVLTPASSDLESATAAGPVKETIEADGSKDEQASEETKGNDPVSEGKNTGSKSATMSAQSSPIKREAEDDISDAESETKRLKSSTLEEGAPSTDVPAETESAPPEPAVQDKPQAGPEAKAAAEADVGSGKSEPTTATDDTPGEAGENEKDDSKPQPADSAA